MNRHDLELYAMGEYDGDAGALEDELARDDAARAMVAEEARLELLLRDAAAAATFCPACDDLVRGARCDACGAAVRPGGYLVERVLVSNAHGRMYAARDADGKQVALKELAFVQSPTVEVVAAFEREVKFLRALDHPAIPRFCASFEEGAGVHVRYYLAQELVTGESLADRLDAHWYSEAEIVGIARQVLDVVVYLQGLSPMVIHRDIKPANLVVRADGTIAVVDFGAAHVQGMTIGSTAIGTFGYMPIEQLAGEVGPTTDLYALGASLLHLMTRKEPWRLLQGTVLAGADANLSRPMRTFLGKLVAPEPRQRFGSAAEARAALDRLGRDRRRARGGRSIRAAVQWLPHRAGWVAVAAAVVAVAGIGAFTVVWEDDVPEPSHATTVASANRAWRAAMLAQLTAYERLACACIDKACVDEVAARITAWSKDLATTTAAEPLDAATVNAITALSSSASACITRAMSGGAVMSEVAATEPVVAGGGVPIRMATIELPMSGMSIHDVAQTLAVSCRFNIVVAGDVNTTVLPRQPQVRCDHALETVAGWSGLDAKRFTRWTTDPARVADGVFRIGVPRETALAEARRDARAGRGLIDDPTPLPRGAAVGSQFDRIPVREALAQLAEDGHVDLDIASSVGGRVSVFVRDMPWDVTLAAVLDATGLAYRYNPRSRRLRIAPSDELDAGRPRGAPYGFLDVDVDTLAGDTLVIDGTVTAVPPGAEIPVRAGKHIVEYRARDGASAHMVNIEAGSHAPAPVGWSSAADPAPGSPVEK